MITGFRRTALQTFGVPGRVGGPFNFSWVLPVNFALQLAGPKTAQFDVPQDYQFCQVGDAGIQIIVQVLDGAGQPVDLRPATAKVIKILLPDGTTKDVAATFLDDGSDGKIFYTTAAIDLSEVGVYRVQGKVTMGNAAKSTQLGTLQVLANVDNT